MIQERVKDDYLAGLRKGDIARGLCWRCKLYDANERNKCSSASTEQPVQRTHGYIAPTWSWASVSSGVIFPYRGQPHPDLEIVDSSLPVSDINPFGIVEPGSLELRGRVLAAVAWRDSKTTKPRCEFNDRSLTFRPYSEDIMRARHSPVQEVSLLPLDKFSQYFHVLVLQLLPDQSFTYRRIDCIRVCMDLDTVFEDADVRNVVIK